ncbi:MAG: PAS domain-containing protein [Gemmatimonadota bacterium]
MSASPDVPETDGRDERFLASSGSFSRGAGIFVFLVGGLSLLGWFFNIPLLLWTSPNQIVMKANAALAFLLSGISLWLIAGEREGRGRRLAGACALLAALLGVLSLIEYAAGWDLGIDQLLVREMPGAVKTSSPGRMAPNAALDFALLGTALFALSRRRGHWPASVMAFVAGTVGLLGMLGHIYADEPAPHFVAHTHIAFQTALALTVLAAGVLLAMKDRGLLGPVAQVGIGSDVARRLLPAVLLVPLLLEWLRHEGELFGLFGDEFGVAVMVVASMAILTLVVQRGADALNRTDLGRKRAVASLAARERELARTTEVLETVFSNVQFMIVYLDSRFNFIRVNPAYAAACGYSPGFFTGKNHFALYPHEENEAIFRRAVETGEPFSVLAKPFEFPDHPEWGVTYWDWSLQPVKDADGTVTGLIFALRDVTQRVRSESRLRESEQRLEMAIEVADLGLWDWSVPTGRAVVNERWARMLGYSPGEIEASFDTWQRLVHPDDLPGVLALLDDQLEGRSPFFEAEYRMRAKTGEWRWVYSRGRVVERDGEGRPLRAAGIQQDITKARELEQAVLRQEKMAVLGQLAAGIAHEIRNPLSGLNIYLAAAETLSAAAELPDPEARERLARALATARSASVKIEGVIRRVMDFVKPSPSRRGLVKLNEVVAESVDMAAVTLRKSGVRLTTALGEGLPDCRADSRLIEQLLLNLITNAAQALESQEGDKTVEIATGTEGGNVFIAVGDSGPGVPAEVREKIFEPFFTTKSTGTGLGLSITRRIVMEHGGSLEVGTSRLGGAEFRVVLPAARERGNEGGTSAPTGGAG